MSQEYKYEIVASGDKVLGNVWWDSEKEEIDTDNPRILEYLKGKTYQDITWHDGVQFLQYLGRILKNGYVHAKRVDK